MALDKLTKIQKIGINTATIPTLGGSENVGVVTATNFIGDGSGLTGVTGSGSGVIVRDGGSLVGTAGTINFGTNLNVSAISAGIVTVTNAASATSLTGLSDVTVTSASNGQILKHNGSVFVNTAERTYSQSSVASGSNVNLRLSDGSTDDDILITAGSNITFSSVSANGFTIAASGGSGGGISNVIEDITPELGGNLNLNNKFITGSGGINVSGVVTATTFSGSLTGDVTGAASQITVADESSDTTGFVVFTNTASGNNAPKTGSNLTFDSADGVLSATKFTGSGVALTGVVTSIVAGANITLTGGPTGIVTIASSGGGGGGGVSLANGVDNRVVTATGAAALNGEPNLTWDGTTLAVVSQQTVSGSIVVGSATTISGDGIHLTGIATATTFVGALTGNAATATALQTARNIGGVSFDGTANINLPGVNTTGNQDTTGNADTATTATNVTVTANNSTNETVYPIFVDGATGAQGAESDTGLSYNPSSGALTAGSFVKSGGNSAQFLKADGSVDSNTYLTSGSYLQNVVEDTSPELGGDLDLNSKNITGTGEIRVVGLVTATSAVKTWTLGASGSSHYTFTGDGFTSATNDPDIYLERGHRYAFLNNAGGTNHPFQIRVSNGGSAYTTGVTYHTEHQSGSNSASQGYITFNVPWDAPATLYYQCTQHPGMGGNIYIRGGNGENTNVGVTRFYHATTNGVALFQSGDAYCNIILQDSNSNSSSKPQFGVQGDDFRFLSHDGSSSTEKLRIGSTGQFKVGNDPTAASGTFTHIEAPTGFNSGETIVQIVGDSSTTGPRLNLQNRNTGADASSEILGSDSGGQSTGSIRFYHTDQSNNYGEIAFGTRNSGTPPVDRARITKDGRFLVGTDTKLADGDGYVQAAVAGVNLGAFFSRSGTNSSRKHVRFANPNGEVGSISTNGSNIVISGESDYRLKENVVTLSNAITRLKTLKPYRFNFKSDPNTTLDGFLAHELTTVPLAIVGEKDAVVTQEMIDSGDFKPEKLNDPIYQQLDTTKLIPLLTAALQESITEIETLKAKVAALEGS